MGGLFAEPDIQNVVRPYVVIEAARISQRVGGARRNLRDLAGGAGGHFVLLQDLLRDWNCAGRLGRCGNKGGARAAQTTDRIFFVGAEIKQFVLDDVPAGQGAPVVVDVGSCLPSSVKKIAGIEEAVAHELEHLAVEFVGTLTGQN